VLGTPELDAILQAGIYQSRVEGEIDLPNPAGHASFYAAQDTIKFINTVISLNSERWSNIFDR